MPGRGFTTNLDWRLGAAPALGGQPGSIARGGPVRSMPDSVDSSSTVTIQYFARGHFEGEAHSSWRAFATSRVNIIRAFAGMPLSCRFTKDVLWKFKLGASPQTTKRCGRAAECKVVAAKIEAVTIM